MTDWIIEYWNDEEKKVECFSSNDGSWEQAPKKNVIYVYVRRKGTTPYGRSDKIYTQVLRGTDNYFFCEKRGIATFGMWNDDGRPAAVNVWHPDGRIESKMVAERPEDIPGEAVKTGIWVKEPWAKELGLSFSHNTARKPTFNRTIKGCRDG